MSLTDWQQRKLDEAYGEADAEALGRPAVGGITWTTCLAPTASGWPCLKGVPVSIHGEPTGKTRCDEHAAVAK